MSGGTPHPFSVVFPDPGPPLAERVGHDLAVRLAALESAARRVRRGSDPEAAHDLRVASRRLASAVLLWRALLEADATRRLLRRLDRVRRAAGRLRDLQVQVELLRGLAGLPAPARIAHEALIARLERRVPRAAARSARRVRRMRMAPIRTLFAAAVADLAGAGPALQAAVDEARRELVRLEGEAREALAAAVASGEDPRFHRARIAVKHWRYAIEGLHAVAPAGAQGAPAPNEALVRDLQRALGRLQDLAGVRARVERRAQRLRARRRDIEADALLQLVPALLAERQAPIDEIRRRFEVKGPRS